MKLKNTVILSLLAHICFFAALLLLPKDIHSNSGKTRAEKVFFVKLAGNSAAYAHGHTSAEAKESKPEKPGLSTTEKKTGVKGNIDAGADSGNLNRGSYNTEETVTPGNFSGSALLPLPESSGNYNVNAPEKREGLHNAAFSEAHYSGYREGATGDRKILPENTLEIIRDSIEKAKAYPVLARKMGIEGTVHISFRVSLKGEPFDMKIIKGSGSSILDTATFNIVEKAAPFPYVDSIIEVPVVFKLN